MKLNKITHPKFNATKRAADFIHIKYKKNTVSNINDLTESYQAFVKLSKGKAIKVLTEIKNTAYFELNDSHCLTADHPWPKQEAIVTNNLAARLAMKLLYKDKEFHQIKLFTSVDCALNWLNADKHQLA